jgi:hypothetical protein
MCGAIIAATSPVSGHGVGGVPRLQLPLDGIRPGRYV